MSGGHSYNDPSSRDAPPPTSSSLSASRYHDPNQDNNGKDSKSGRKSPMASISVTVSCEEDASVVPPSPDPKRPTSSSASLPRRSSRSGDTDNVILRHNSCKVHSVLTDRKSASASKDASSQKSLSSILSPSTSYSNISAIVSSSASSLASVKSNTLAYMSGNRSEDTSLVSVSPTPSLPANSPLNYVLTKDPSSSSNKLSSHHHHHSNFSSFSKGLKRSPLSRSRSGGIFSNPFKR